MAIAWGQYKSPMGGSVKFDLRKLYEIQNQLGKKYTVQVGILGNSSSRKATVQKKTYRPGEGKNKAGKGPSDLSNADVGKIQEFGSATRNTPARSFLRMPLYLKLPRVLDKLGQSVIDSLKTSNIKQTYKLLGIMAEKIIQGAFATRGFGRWQPNAPLTVQIKGSDAPLIDTAQLRKSITSKVVEA